MDMQIPVMVGKTEVEVECYFTLTPPRKATRFEPGEFGEIDNLYCRARLGPAPGALLNWVEVSESWVLEHAEEWRFYDAVGDAYADYEADRACAEYEEHLERWFR